MLAWLKCLATVKTPPGSVVCRSLTEQQSTFRASLVFALGRMYTAVIMVVNSLGHLNGLHLMVKNSMSERAF